MKELIKNVFKGFAYMMGIFVGFFVGKKIFKPEIEVEIKSKEESE